MIRPRKFRTQKARKRERIRVALRVGALALGVALLVVGAVYATHYPFMRISATTFDTDGTLGEAELSAVVSEAMRGNVLGVLPQDSIFLPATALVERQLITSFPRIATVNAEREGLRAVHVTIRERAPSALWCGDVVPPQPADAKGVPDEGFVWGNCYLMDAESYIYDRAPVYSGNPFVHYYGSIERSNPIGQYMLDKEEFALWQELFRAWSADGIVIQAILVVDERDVELHLARGIRVIAGRSQLADVLHDRLIALLDSDTIDTNKTIDYVDMRYGAKVYVKYMPPASEEVSVGL